jgi:hypothetical protein
VPAARTAGAVDIRPGQTAFVLVSVLWRTVQRYGLRGYRYCLLDAGIMAAHLAGVLRATGARRVTVATVGPGDAIVGGLSLGPAEAGLLQVVVEDGWPAAGPPPWSSASASPVVATSAATVGCAEPPYLSPTLTRIRRARELAAEPASRVDAWPLQLPRPDLEDYLRGRRSADAFGPGPGPGPDAVRGPAGVPSDRERSERCDGSALAERWPGCWADLDRLAHQAVSRSPWIMRTGLCFRVLRRSQLGDRWADVVRACQGQRIVAEAHALVVFGLLGAPRTHPVFTKAVLDAGFAVARMYETSWRAGWATTTIGGFADRQLAGLTGWPGFQPIVAQAFGHPAHVNGACRSDVVRSAVSRPRDGRRMGTGPA